MGVETTPEPLVTSGEAVAESLNAAGDNERVFVEKRPTAVSVVGWAWIVIGALTLLGSASNLQLMLVTDSPEAFGTWWPAAVAVQSLLGAVGLYAGIRFLRLDERARRVLEYLTLAIAILLVGSSVAGLVSFGFDLDALFDFVLVMAFMLALYGVPLFFMLTALRSQRVRDAMRLLPTKRGIPSASR